MLVTESTPFGFYDLRLAVDVVRAIKVPFGVIINRYGLETQGLRNTAKPKEFLFSSRSQMIERLQSFYSKGIPFVREMPEWNERFLSVFEAIKLQLAGKEEAGI